MSRAISISLAIHALALLIGSAEARPVKLSEYAEHVTPDGNWRGALQAALDDPDVDDLEIDGHYPMWSVAHSKDCAVVRNSGTRIHGGTIEFRAPDDYDHETKGYSYGRGLAIRSGIHDIVIEHMRIYSSQPRVGPLPNGGHKEQGALMHFGGPASGEIPLRAVTLRDSIVGPNYNGDVFYMKGSEATIERNTCIGPARGCFEFTSAYTGPTENIFVRDNRLVWPEDWDVDAEFVTGKNVRGIDFEPKAALISKVTITGNIFPEVGLELGGVSEFIVSNNQVGYISITKAHEGVVSNNILRPVAAEGKWALIVQRGQKRVDIAGNQVWARAVQVGVDASGDPILEGANGMKISTWPQDIEDEPLVLPTWVRVYDNDVWVDALDAIPMRIHRELIYNAGTAAEKDWKIDPQWLMYRDNDLHGGLGLVLEPN